MKSIRILPLVILAASALLFLKVVDFVSRDFSTFEGIGVAQAQEAEPAIGDLDGSSGEDSAGGMDGNAIEEEPALPVMEPLNLGDRVSEPGVSRSELAILERLSERRKELERRREVLDVRETLIRAAEKRVTQRIETLKELERTIGVASRKRDEQKRASMSALITMYEQMKPKSAAKIMENLQLETLITLSVLMQPKKMSLVMAAMKPELAGRLTMAIAIRGQQTETASPDVEGGELPKIGN
ncbi:MAG: hypothetical protein JKY49_03710 [Cohaesibacteraceae bacterium]|nr:hypothetical protein [Cohaesibacteraceae bacterium]MBL4875572.1 hypothetical protein [Cohaesibacteraceae bacterium]